MQWVKAPISSPADLDLYPGINLVVPPSPSWIFPHQTKPRNGFVQSGRIVSCSGVETETIWEL